MYGISRKAKKGLAMAYKDYFDMVMKEQELKLSLDEKKALGQKVLDDLLEQSFNRLDIPEDEQSAFRKEFEQLIRKKFPESLLDTPLKFTGTFTGKAFQDKEK